MQNEKTQNTPDYYVRVRAVHFQCAALRHIRSEVEGTDAEGLSRAWEGASASALFGSSEWVTESDPPVSLGWDWMLTTSGDVLMNRHSIRTNLMLVDHDGSDLGHTVSIETVVRTIENFAWQRHVLLALQGPPLELGSSAADDC